MFGMARVVRTQSKLLSAPKICTQIEKSVREDERKPVEALVANLPRSVALEPVKVDVAKEILAGLVVAVATIPTSISYSNVVGLNPLLGIWTSAIVGFFTTLVGGGPGLIAGAAGVIALPMGKLVAAHGKEHMALAVILSGALDASFGIVKLGKLLDVVTEPVIAGFLNSFAIFLVTKQMKVLQNAKGDWLEGATFNGNLITLLTSALLIKGFPMLVRNSKIPPSLVGIAVSALVAIAAKFPIKSLADQVGKATFAGGLQALPSFIGLPKVPVNGDSLSKVASTVIGAMLIGVIETVLAMRIYSKAYRAKALPPSELKKEDYNRINIGLGLGNIVSALFGGFGGCGLIPNTLLNGSSGGLHYLSAFSYSAFLALLVIAFSPILGKIPLASLAGLMVIVAYNTFEWLETKHILEHSVQSAQGFMDLLAMIVSGYICYTTDMGLGVAVGVAIAQALPLLKKLKG